MIDKIDRIFHEIDSKLFDLRQNVNFTQNHEIVSAKIEKIFDSDFQKNKFNSKWLRLMAELNTKFKNDLKNLQTSNKLAYFKYQSDEKVQNKLVHEIAPEVNNRSNFVHGLINLHQLGRIFVQNELSILKKFRYMDFYFDYEAYDLRTASEFYQLNKDKYVIYDVKSYELCLVNRDFLLLKKIKIHPIFSFIFVDIHNAQLVISLNNHGCWPAKTFIYLFDQNLNLLGKKLQTEYIYSNVSSEKKKLVYTDPSTNAYVLLDRDLSFIECYNFNTEKINVKDGIHLNSSTVYSLISSKGLIQICDRKSGDLIKEVNVESFIPDYVSLWIKIDFVGNIFIFVRDGLGALYHLLCFDINGRFLFKRRMPLLSEYMYMEFNDDNVYFYYNVY
jgi:hypothetical protein